MKRLILLLAILALPSQALADMAPSNYGSAALTVPAESLIQMDHEVVHFTIPQPSNNYPESQPKIQTTATFWMANPTNKSLTVTSTFPLSNADDILYVQPETVRVNINGKTILGITKETKYSARNPYSNTLENLTANGYEFPLTIPANSTTAVIIQYVAPFTDDGKCTLNTKGFSYYLGSGAGWKGPIKEARIEMEYPLDHSEGLITLVDNGTRIEPTKELKGNTLTYTFKNLEPTTDSQLYFTYRDTQIEKETRAANAEIIKNPNSPEAYHKLAAADREQYVSSTIKALELQYGSSTNPNTGAAAYEVAQFYTGQWLFIPDGQCAEETNPAPINELLRNIRNHTWQQSDYADLQKIQAKLDEATNGWQGEGNALKDYGYVVPLTLAPLSLVTVSSTTETQTAEQLVPNNTARNIAIALLSLLLLGGVTGFVIWKKRTATKI